MQKKEKGEATSTETGQRTTNTFAYKTKLIRRLCLVQMTMFVITTVDVVAGHP